MSVEQKIIITKPGVDTKAITFPGKCKICDTEYKFCLDAVEVTCHGNEETKFIIKCPTCNDDNIPDIGKYNSLLLKRRKYFNAYTGDF